jgi:thioredoxin 1
MNVSQADPQNFESATLAPGLNVIYFWGPDCPNCDVFAADLPQLLPLLPSEGTLVKVNAYAYPELARRFAVFGIPAFVVFRDGAKIGMMRQYNGKAFFTAVLHENAAAPERQST